jgi:hypothetical protein
MKMLLEFLEHARQFEKLAAETEDTTLREQFLSRQLTIESWPKRER